MTAVAVKPNWDVVTVVDDDGHLNVYITTDDPNGVINQIDTGQGDGDGEQLALRFTTAKLETDYQHTVLPLEWSTADSKAAEQEGWDIFDSKGSANGDWQLQKIDDPSIPHPFVKDQEAWVIVARGETELHRKAMAFLQLNNRQEWLAIINEAGIPGLEDISAHE